MNLDLEKVITVDFETYFDSKYSLRAKEHNTSSYIRDPQFLAHCVAIKRGTGPTQVYWYDDIRPAIEAVCWADSELLCHNTAFDGFILAEHYHVVPRRYLDTLSMARALHGNQTRASLDALAQFYHLGNKNKSILGKMRGHRAIPPEIREEAQLYCRDDVDMCFDIFKQMIPCYPDAEIALIDLTLRMFCDPVLKVDLPRAAIELDAEQQRKTDLIDKTGLDESELQSAAKFADQLRALDVEPPMKISARTGLEAYAFAQTDDGLIELAAHPNPDVRDLIAARLAAKSTIGETRAQRFLTAGADGRTLPVLLNYYGAHTGRWSGGNKMNMQNLPRAEYDPETKEYIMGSAELRRSVIAPEGHVIVVADSRQIEPRTLAWFAGQNDLVHLFKTGGDPYVEQAAFIYGCKPEEVTKTQRAVGKATVLGCGYYMGAPRFQGTLALGILGPKIDLPLSECERAVQGYRKKNDQIVQVWKDMELILYRMLMKSKSDTPEEGTTYKDILEYDGQSIWLPNGLPLHYPDLQASFNPRNDTWGDYSYRSNKEYVRIHPGVLIENINQALARIVVGIQMLAIAEQYRVVTMSHDEIVCVAPEIEADRCLAFMIEQMSIPPAWAPGLPVDAEGGWDYCYSK